MRHLYLLFILLTILFATKVESLELKPRAGQYCKLLSRKIYCFSGAIVEGASSNDEGLNSLDVYNNNRVSTQELNNQWEKVNPIDPYNFGTVRRYGPQVAVAPDGEQILIQGGYDSYRKPITYQTVVYNSRTNTWDHFSNYNDVKNGGDRQIYFGSGEYIPNLDGFGFFGGRQTHANAGSSFTTPDNIIINNITYNDFDNIPTNLIGFYYFTLFDMKTNTWTVPLPQINVPSMYRITFSATYYPKDKKMFYIGGAYFDATRNQYDLIDMSHATIFNTVNSSWSEELINNEPPSRRELHTATLLPNGDDILLYGGALLDSYPVTDYCYILNIPTMSWKVQSLVAPAKVSGPRSQHSAVLVDNTSLFVLFGIDLSENLVNQLLILDVRDANNIIFANNFPLDNLVPVPVPHHVTSLSRRSDGIGELAGTVIGSLIAVALAILVFVCHRRRKKNKQTSTRPSSIAHSEVQENNETGVMEVDWDKIENQYREVASPDICPPSTTYHQQQNQTYSTPQHYVSINFSSETDSSTAISTGPILPDTVIPSTTTRAIIPDVGDV